MLTPLVLIPTSIALLAAGAWLWILWQYAELRRVASSIPIMHPTWPIIGHLHLCAGGLVGLTELVLEMSMKAVENGIYTTTGWMGPVPNLYFHNPKDVKILLRSSKSQVKFEEINLSRFVLGEGLLTASGDLWRMKRRHLNPLFHPHNLEYMRPVFNSNSRQLVERLSRMVDQGPVDIMEYVTDAALSTVCTLIFGPKVTIDEESEAFRGIKTVNKSCSSLFIKRLSRFWLRSDFIFELLYKRELSNIDKMIRAFTDGPLKVAMSEDRERELIEDGESNEKITKGEYTSLVGAYITLQKSNPKITTQDLRHEIVTLYFTGSDTVSIAVSSCVLALAQYPDVQEKLFEEIMSVVGVSGDVEADDLKAMPYLDQVVKETLRRFTIVPYIGRKTTDDLRLSDCTVPSGSTVYVSLIGTLMDPKQYPDPLRFNPERFSSHDDDLIFMPLSNGSRKCIGEQYSKMLIKIMVVHIVRRFRLSTEMDINNLRRELVVALVSVDGYKVTLTDRP